MTHHTPRSESLLHNPHSIVLVDNIEDDVDVMFIARVETPGYDHGLLFPVLAHENRGFPGNWLLSPVDGFAHIPHIVERLEEKIQYAEAQGDTVAVMIGGMLKKNNFSRQALIRACDTSDFWRDHIYNAFNECTSQATVFHYIDYPAAHKEHSATLNALVYLTEEQRRDVSMFVDNYILSYARWQNFNQLSGSKRKQERDNELNRMLGYREELNEITSNILGGDAPNVLKDDNGNLYIAPPKV